ncbi:MAG TPA: PAS domain-containing protein [Acidimicrobiales bacterium]|nr:PAS domain-containing protein [Acidimicrobiales bacterium]
MQRPSSTAGEPIPGRPGLSDEVISPDAPPDAKDGFRLLVDGATEYAVFALSPTGVVSTWNRGAERIQGYLPDEVIGTHFSVFYPDFERRAGVPERSLETALAEGRFATEGWRLRKDGTRFWASVVITPLYDDTGRVRGFGKLTRDETERRDNHSQAARLEEQERIAVTLAEALVRRLFAIGLHASGLLPLTSNPEAQRRARSLVEETDEAIRYLRTAIFEIRAPGDGPGRS